MQSKIVSKRKSFVAVLAGLIALSPALIFNFDSESFHLSAIKGIYRNSTPSIKNTVVLITTEEQADTPVSTVGLPVRLKIPKINVDSDVEYVGLSPDGAMDVPKERANTAWFELGQRPGDNGSAVIAGHYGWNNRKGSVFDDLHKLRKGDKLYIEDDQGLITSFIVRESRRYDPKADSSGVFSSNDGKAHLNLVTCEGEWSEVAQQYSKRLVVFTDKE